jgi:hypothetical protein
MEETCHLEAAAASNAYDDLVKDPLYSRGCGREGCEKAGSNGVYGTAGDSPWEVVPPTTNCIASAPVSSVLLLRRVY